MAQARHTACRASGRPARRGAPARAPVPSSLEDFFANIGADPFRNAFRTPRPVHPFVGMMPVPESQVRAIWDQLRRTPRSAPSVAYVHIPFCISQCAFCGFYQNRWYVDDGPVYVDALIDQLRRDREQPYQAEGPIRAVYLGGGTPTLLAAKDLARAIRAVREHLPLTADCEITVEGRIHGFGADKAKAAFDAGASRLSIGVQSFDTALRQRMGRRCDRGEVVSALAKLVGLDRGAIIIDLIYGLPGQTSSVWADDVRQAIALDLDGLDLYALKTMRETPLARATTSGHLSAPSPVPATDLGGYFRRGAELLDSARWDTLSSSHWRNGTRERNVYNLLIKSGADCVAVGAGAGGFLSTRDGTGYSYRNEANVTDYRARIRTGALVVAGLLRQSPHRRLFDRIKGGLELGRLDLGALAWELRSHSGQDLAEVAGPLFAQWQEARLLVQSGGWLELTLAGRYWQVQLTQSLLRWLEQSLDEPL